MLLREKYKNKISVILFAKILGVDMDNVNVFSQRVLNLCKLLETGGEKLSDSEFALNKTITLNFKE